MKLTVFNGSPRGTKSNTKVLLDEFVAGFESVSGNSSEVRYLKDTDAYESCVDLFRSADAVLLAFPLYVDSMPGLVKEFIEHLAGIGATPTLLFLVQSGFPEASHSRRVERYLQKLARRLNCPCPGVIVKGGIEGIKVKPQWMTKKVKSQIRTLGDGFARTGSLDAALLKTLARPERLSAVAKVILTLLTPTGLIDSYWNMMLKKHKAFEKRYARPYAATKGSI